MYPSDRCGSVHFFGYKCSISFDIVGIVNML